MTVAVVAADAPPEGGVALATQMVRRGTRVVLMTNGEAPPLREALRAGVRVVVDAEDDLERAVAAAERGDLLLGRAAAALLPALAAAPGPAFPELSEREREVIAELAAHDDLGRVARRLGLTAKTVRHHVGQILAKTGAADAAAAGRLARRAGVIA